MSSWIPTLIAVTTTEIPNETEPEILSELTREIPIEIPSEMAIKTTDNTQSKALLRYLDRSGNPTFFHFISSGYGARWMWTPLRGKLFLDKQPHRLIKLGGGLYFSISSLPFEDLIVIKTILFSSSST